MKAERMLVGDVLARLQTLPAASVDSVVTSPPYFALRDYQVGGQLGLEATVTAWVANLLAVGDELARVLKPQGTLWLNLGDSYSRGIRYGAAAKSLLLAPERLLLGLADRGWLVRNKLVWAKPNPMPVSVTDRFNCTWEPIYLLTRLPHYYFDLDAVRVPHRTAPRKGSSPSPMPPINGGRQSPKWAGPLAGDQAGLSRLKAAGLPGHPLGKNPGDVWTIGTSGRREGSHHAVFPEGLIERPILAGTPERVCLACGHAWQRARVARPLGRLAVVGALAAHCDCSTGWQPGLVLDPFMGSGTVALVAERLGRRWLGIELNERFADEAMARVATARTMRRQAA